MIIPPHITSVDWISHLLFSLALGSFILKDRSRETMALVAAASLLPDLDTLWYPRSGLHSPLVLLALALVPAIKNRALLTPLLVGFWSHSALDIFLFDNSNHTIKNLANQIVSNESVAQNIENGITMYTAADGIMLFYPFSSETFSITLGEESYALIAGFIAAMAVIAFLRFRGLCGK